MHKLYEFACAELEELEQKADKGLSNAELEYANKLTEMKKNILKIEMLEDGGYSADDEMSMDRGSYRNSYRGDNSYRDGGSNRGSYARGRGRNARRDSMGRYSRDGSYRYSREDGYSMAADEIVDQLEDMKESAPDESSRREISKLIEKMRNA